jgi:hypothetical protein
MALPAPGTTTKAAGTGVNLKAVTYIDYLNQDAFNAIPIYQLAQTEPDAIFALASLGGIPALLTYAATGNTDAFIPADDGSGGYAALSGLSSYRDFNASGNVDDLQGIDNFSAIPAYEAFAASGNIDDLAGIDNFSAIPSLELIQAGERSGYYGIDATSALQPFDQFNAGGGLHSFTPVDDDPTTTTVDESQPGYAALSALEALKAYQDSNGSDMSLLNPIAAFSAIQAVPPNSLKVQAKVAAAPVVEAAAPEVTAEVTTQDVTTENVTTEAVSAPVAPAAADPAPSGKKAGNGSYAGNFSPVGAPVLFGSGGGKSAADNGMRGYGAVANGLRKALGMGPDKSADSAGGSSDAG